MCLSRLTAAREIGQPPLSHQPNWWPFRCIGRNFHKAVAGSRLFSPLHPPRCHPRCEEPELKRAAGPTTPPSTGNNLLLAAIFPSAGLDRNVAQGAAFFDNGETVTAILALISKRKRGCERMPRQG